MQLNELEEGEIALSADSHEEIQQSGSWNHNCDDGEDEHVMQPKLKRKRSKRFRSRHTIERLEEKFSSYRTFSQHGSHPRSHVQHDNDMLSRMDGGVGEFNAPFFIRSDISPSSLKQSSYCLTRRAPIINKHKAGGSSYFSGCEEDALDHSRESWNGKASYNTGPGLIKSKMSDSMQRKVRLLFCTFYLKMEFLLFYVLEKCLCPIFYLFR